MPKIIHVSLTPEQRAELYQRARQRDLPPRLRDRLEMVRLSDDGWSIPRIAAYLRTHELTVRKYIKAFDAHGFAALPDRSRSGRPPTVTAAHLRSVEEYLADAKSSERPSTLAEVVAWLRATHGVNISAGRLSALLHARQVRWGWSRAPGRRRRSGRASPGVARPAELAS